MPAKEDTPAILARFSSLSRADATALFHACAIACATQTEIARDPNQQSRSSYAMEAAEYQMLSKDLAVYLREKGWL